MADLPDRSPSETLMECLEQFGRAEPKRVLVIWVDENGDLCWSNSTPRSFTSQIGMLECVRAIIMKQFLEVPE